jgi:spermidine synthase
MTNLATARFYLIVATAGAVLMAFEILSARLLSPHFGSSVYVWGSVISVFLAAMSLGYWWGGRLADRSPSLVVLGTLLLVAGLCMAWIGFAGQPLIAVVAEKTGSSPWGTLLAAGLLFGPATVLLATVSPFAIKLATRDVSRLGKTAGRLYAISTIGSLAGTLICTFVLIPLLRIELILGLLLAVTAITGCAALAEQLGQQKLRAVLAVSLLAAAVATARPAVIKDKSLLFKRMTPYQTLIVEEHDGVRYLKSDRVQHSSVRLSDGLPVSRSYPRFAAGALLLQPELESLLVVGMGAGNVGTYLRSQLPELAVDYVDIDPAIPEAARQFLLFEEAAGIEVHVDDGRRFLAASQKQWDYIYVDTYIGNSIPFHLCTVEFFRQVDRHLTPGGVVGINLSSSLDRPFARAMLRSVSEVFPSVYVVSVQSSTNQFVMASATRTRLPVAALEARASELDRRWDLEPSLGEIVRRHSLVDLDLLSVEPLSDQFAPVNYLVRFDAE